jgi:hypothetical protein
MEGSYQSNKTSVSTDLIGTLSRHTHTSGSIQNAEVQGTYMETLCSLIRIAPFKSCLCISSDQRIFNYCLKINRSFLFKELLY